MGQHPECDVCHQRHRPGPCTLVRPVRARRLPDSATAAEPGSAEKLEELCRRAAQRRALWHPGDVMLDPAARAWRCHLTRRARRVLRCLLGRSDQDD
jgi:hypothetical protein